MSEPMLWVLDRIEDGEAAVLVSPSGEERVVPRASLPPGAREGDALREAERGPGRTGETAGAGSDLRDGPIDGGSAPSDLRFVVDADATERLRNEARDLRSSLRRGPSGPISL